MFQTVTLPDLACPRPRLSVWYVREGETVFAGERLAEILVDGATIDLPSPVSGRVVERHALMNDILAPGQLLAVLESP